MAIYAQLNSENLVTNVIVADENFVSKLPNSGSWVLGEYPVETKKPRANIGMRYDSALDRFIGPQLYPSWTLNSDYMWVPPVPYPSGSIMYRWDETSKSWIQR